MDRNVLHAHFSQEQNVVKQPEVDLTFRFNRPISAINKNVQTTSPPPPSQTTEH